MVTDIGDVLVGASSDEPSNEFSTAARDTMSSVTGVDVTSIMYRYKFTFVAQVGSPQIQSQDEDVPSIIRRPRRLNSEVLRKPSTK